MGMRAYCPACDAETSSILAGFRDKGACPNCGLSAVAAEAFVAALNKGANRELIERAAKAEQRAEVAERELQRLRAGLKDLGYQLTDLCEGS